MVASIPGVRHADGQPRARASLWRGRHRPGDSQGGRAVVRFERVDPHHGGHRPGLLWPQVVPDLSQHRHGSVERAASARPCRRVQGHYPDRRRDRPGLVRRICAPGPAEPWLPYGNYEAVSALAFKTDLSWADLEFTRNTSGLPVVVQAGAAAVQVSNHGGRALDGTPASITVLPKIADALQGDAPIILDSGIRRGMDVAKYPSLARKGALVLLSVKAPDPDPDYRELGPPTG
jgi:FMN-dependent dehydrogenase